MQPLISIFENELAIPKNLMSRIVPFYREESLEKNAFLVEKGKYCDKMVILQSGYLRFFSYSDKKDVTHWIFGANQLVTDAASFFLQQPAKWNIQAFEEGSP